MICEKQKTLLIAFSIVKQSASPIAFSDHASRTLGKLGSFRPQNTWFRGFVP